MGHTHGELIFWSIALGLVLFIYAILISYHQVVDEKRINALENKTVTLEELGLTTECTDLKTVERYEVINETNCAFCDKWQGCCSRFYPNISFDDCMNLRQTNCSSVEACIINCNKNSQRPYIKFWNESVCIKQIVVVKQ